MHTSYTRRCLQLNRFILHPKTDLTLACRVDLPRLGYALNINSPDLDMKTKLIRLNLAHVHNNNSTLDAMQ